MIEYILIYCNIISIKKILKLEEVFNRFQLKQLEGSVCNSLITNQTSNPFSHFEMVDGWVYKVSSW